MGSLVTRRGPHRLLLLFLVATIVPAGALVWLGWQLVSQDAQLERQRMTDLVAAAAVSAVAAADQELRLSAR